MGRLSKTRGRVVRVRPDVVLEFTRVPELQADDHPVTLKTAEVAVSVGNTCELRAKLHTLSWLISVGRLELNRTGTGQGQQKKSPQSSRGPTSNHPPILGQPGHTTIQCPLRFTDLLPNVVCSDSRPRVPLFLLGSSTG